MRRLLGLLLGTGFASAASVLAAPPSVVANPAPVPAQIAAAKTVFISNAGLDASSLGVFERIGNLNEPYDQLYSRMKAWGKYALVTAPSDADVVFEIRFAWPVTDCTKGTTHQGGIKLTILDAKTHFILWTIDEPVVNAILAGTWEKNVDSGVAAAVRDVQALTAQNGTH